MCGITGFVCYDNIASHPFVLRSMTDALQHRGPDGSGYWLREEGGVALGHRRLSVVDPSPAGSQPMASASGRYRITYNGEIYNAADLRRQLEATGATFRGHSDTEVLIAAIDAWGLEASLAWLAGMFAFAIFDSHRMEVTLARDRLGIKPLYYALVPRGIVFGSELKALLRFPGFDTRVNRRALELFMRDGYVPGPLTIYERAFKLPPGTTLTVSAQEPLLHRALGRHVPWPQQRSSETLAPVRYWAPRSGHVAPGASAGSSQEYADELDQLLTDVLREHIVSDVPLGAFLSGGVDSSLVVAIMQKATPRVRTFSIGFEVPDFDESAHARAVAKHLGTEHTELRLSSTDALGIVPRLAALYDEPFADSSQIPMVLLCELARKHVTVSLSGDGGDELFAGYVRYFEVLSLWKRLEKIPHALRRFAGSLLAKLPEEAWVGTMGAFRRIAPRGPWPRVSSARRIADLLLAEDLNTFYTAQLARWPEGSLLLPGSERQGALADTSSIADERELSPLRQLMLTDIARYLPDDILVKVDRASMCVGLEARVPLLDHRIVDWALALPESQLGRGKRLLRQVLYRYVPSVLMERPKRGFSVPLADWLRGPLAAWARDLTASSRLEREGFFDARSVEKAWRLHDSRKADRHAQLWNVTMFQAWLDHVTQA